VEGFQWNPKREPATDAMAGRDISIDKNCQFAKLAR